MVKVLSIIIILLAVLGAGYYLGEVQNRDTDGVKKTTSTPSEKPTIPQGWIPYENDEFGFSMAYPPEWEVQEALKPRELRALHDIYFHEKEYDMWRAEFTVRIFTNPDGHTIEEWWDEWLREEDEKEAECHEEYADTAPCLFLRGIVEWEERVQLSGQEAIRVGLFRFDHEEECTYVAHNENILGICYAGTNPNDPQAEEHSAITANMHGLFMLR